MRGQGSGCGGLLAARAPCFEPPERSTISTISTCFEPRERSTISTISTCFEPPERSTISTISICFEPLERSTSSTISTGFEPRERSKTSNQSSQVPGEEVRAPCFEPPAINARRRKPGPRTLGWRARACVTTFRSLRPAGTLVSTGPGLSSRGTRKRWSPRRRGGAAGGRQKPNRAMLDRPRPLEGAPACQTPRPRKRGPRRQQRCLVLRTADANHECAGCLCAGCIAPSKSFVTYTA